MRRLRARFRRTKRAYGKVPRNGERALITSITLEGAVGATMTIEGATETKAFEDYMERFLVPTLE